MTNMDLNAILTGFQHPEDDPEWARMNTQEKTVAIKISEMCRLAQQEIERLEAKSNAQAAGIELLMDALSRAKGTDR